jgi:hypothetical protein
VLDEAFHTLNRGLTHGAYDMRRMVRTILLERAPDLFLPGVQAASHVRFQSVKVELTILGSLIHGGINLAARTIQVGLRHHRIALDLVSICVEFVSVNESY